ncbi:uncharacterized protein LOC112613895 [Theropithecus gelada]|uniref:uncharacterized protein LOC112613895 n=1 Tax=Theropithecus gelada TaxID=9565 RepID=UPI000DC1AD76|nr:uncharacterized protein LOC112613895 [Theropithecus gelada]
MESITAVAGESVSARGQVFARWRGHPYALPPSSSTSPRALGPGSSNKVTLDWGGGSTTLFSGPKGAGGAEGGPGARLCGGSGPWRPGAAPSAARSLQKRIFYAPRPSLGSRLGRGGFFFLEVPFFFTVEDLRLGSNRGGGCRARGAPPTPGARLPGAWEGAAPAGGGRAPPEAAAAINLPVISANETWNASRPEDGKGSGFDKRRPACLGILSPAGWKMQRCFQRGAEELRGKK